MLIFFFSDEVKNLSMKNYKIKTSLEPVQMMKSHQNIKTFLEKLKEKLRLNK